MNPSTWRRLGDDEPDEVVWPGDPDHEDRDIHEADEPLAAALDERTGPRRAAAFRPRSVRKIRGGVTVYDYRGTGLCPPNGGRITPVVWVDHIPVIHNAAGVGDLETLGNVLRQQGLAVQRGTDAEGNVALFTTLHELCWHARGVNQISVGCEHMHYATNEPWSERQYRAAAWCRVNAYREVRIPLRTARLVSGNGLAGVSRTGHTTHQKVSAYAGYNDRTDPGTLFRSAYVDELARFFLKRGRF